MEKRTTVGLIAAALLCGLIVAGMMIWRDVRRVASIGTEHEQIVDLDALVTKVRDLNRLETAAMHVVHISTINQTYDMIPNALAGDELTFFAAGDVIAGIDLSQLTKNDVRHDPDGTIVLHLPPPQILVTRLDNRESRVLSRKTGMLRRADIDLETRARQNAETGIRTEALHKGILNLAAQNAETKLAAILHTLGAEKVRFEQTPRVRTGAG
jgi:hypothetical protein